MPIRRWTGSAGVVFHVLNRGVRRLRLFDEIGDYEAFVRVFQQAQTRVPIRCLSYCLMPNHFHLVLWPREDSDIFSFMSWLTLTHSKRWHRWRGTNYFGASLKALTILGAKKGYELVGCNFGGTNAFFVRRDLLADHFRRPFTAENHFEPVRYFLYRKNGHPREFGPFEIVS